MAWYVFYCCSIKFHIFIHTSWSLCKFLCSTLVKVCWRFLESGLQQQRLRLYVEAFDVWWKLTDVWILSVLKRGGANSWMQTSYSLGIYWSLFIVVITYLKYMYMVRSNQWRCAFCYRQTSSLKCYHVCVFCWTWLCSCARNRNVL